MTHERCGIDYYHRPHEWREGNNLEDHHFCDGGSDEIDAWDQAAAQDELFERGAY